MMKKKSLLQTIIFSILLIPAAAGGEGEPAHTQPVQWEAFFSTAWEHSRYAKEKKIELQSYKLEADTAKNNLYPQITFEIPELIGWKRVNAAPFAAYIPSLAGTQYLNAVQGSYGIRLTQQLPSGGSLTATGTLQTEYLAQAELYRQTPQFSLLYRQPLTRGAAAFFAESRAVHTRFQLFQTMHKQAYHHFMKSLLERIAALDTLQAHTEYYRLYAVYRTAAYHELEKKHHAGTAAVPDLLEAKRIMLKAQQDYELSRTAAVLHAKSFTVQYGNAFLTLSRTDKENLVDFLRCTDARNNNAALILAGEKQLIETQILSAKKDEAPQLLLKFSALPDELAPRFAADYRTSWELLNRKMPWLFQASIGITWSPDYLSRAAAKTELLKNRSTLLDVQLRELQTQRQQESQLLHEKIDSLEQTYRLMQHYTDEHTAVLAEYRQLYEHNAITESTYAQIGADYALQHYEQTQTFWQLIAAKSEYLFL